ncbi:MAG: hypothetical protein QOF31_2494 [Mycobacterium sp.]|jgi:hypothetical protein|nr:hypothetical protein [Mycobacterium sp.]
MVGRHVRRVPSPLGLNLTITSDDGGDPLFRLFRSADRPYDVCMPAAVAPIVRRVAERARRDVGFARVLDALLAAPTTPQGTLERITAHKLNSQRRAALVQDFVDGSMPTPDVQALLGLRTPQAVHRLRTRGKLLGAAVGNRTWFPAWQFDDDRVRPDLPRILELLARFTFDPLAADRIMRLKHDELGGISIAEALRNTQTAETAWRMLTSIGA